MNELALLDQDELQKVSGAWVANAAGAIAGGIGGFYGSIIAGGQNATFSSIATGTLAGMAVGAFNPVRGFGSLATSIGGGAGAGAITNVGEDIELALE